MTPIIFIGCSVHKSMPKGKARDVYCGGFFRLCLRWAEQTSDRVYILSTRYGVIKPSTIIESYDSALQRAAVSDSPAVRSANLIASSPWEKKVTRQINRIVNRRPGSEIIYCCGRSYYQNLPAGRTPWAANPRGIGVMRHWLSVHIR